WIPPMPEGDVLLRVTRRLQGALAGRKVTRSELRTGPLGGVDLTGHSVTECVSHGKNTLIRFDSGRTLHVHLKMDGVWRIDETTLPPAHYGDWRIRIVLGNGDWTCVCRLPGEVHLLRTADEPRLLGTLGPDLLAGEPGACEAKAPDFPGIAARPAGSPPPQTPGSEPSGRYCSISGSPRASGRSTSPRASGSPACTRSRPPTPCPRRRSSGSTAPHRLS